MTNSSFDGIDLSRFNAIPDPNPTLPNRRPHLLSYTLAGYILFCIWIYTLLVQLVRRKRTPRQGKSRKRRATVVFEEEVLIVRVAEKGTGDSEEGKYGDYKFGKLKS